MKRFLTVMSKGRTMFVAIHFEAGVLGKAERNPNRLPGSAIPMTIYEELDGISAPFFNFSQSMPSGRGGTVWSAFFYCPKTSRHKRMGRSKVTRIFIFDLYSQTACQFSVGRNSQRTLASEC